jgi:hypothetical protein
MLVTAVVLLGVVAAAAVFALVVVVAPHVRVLRRQRVIVNLRSGPSLTGVVLRDWGARIELGDARIHEAGESRPLDGRAVAWKSNVEFVQVLPPLDPDAGGS